MKMTSKQLARVLIDAIECEKKTEVEKITISFIRFLACRGELRRLPDVIRAIDQIWQEKFGVSTISIESAYPLSSVLKKQIEKIASGAEVRETINEKLISGIRLRIDDRVLDASIIGRLHQLKSVMMS